MPYTTWSLFLVCDPSWLHPKQANTLSDLHSRYVFFGDATGPAHAAVWFVKGDKARSEKDRDSRNLDVGRSRGYCQRFGLVPSEGPFIVVTTINPDRWASGQSRVVLAFARQTPREIQLKISKLSDQLAAGQLSQLEVDSESWWRSLLGILERACQFVDKFKWSLEVSAGKIPAGVKVEPRGRICP